MHVFKRRKARQKNRKSQTGKRAHSHQQATPKDYTEQRRNPTTPQNPSIEVISQG